ncbi:MAG: protein kinase [Verrucomicrobia bacterium]|nr:protein kinase [Verrucomicrobiota bacterium]
MGTSGQRTLVFVTGLIRGSKAEENARSFTYRHAELVREILEQFEQGKELGRFENSLLILFPEPALAVRFSLKLQVAIRALADEAHQPIFEQEALLVVPAAAAEEPDSEPTASAYEGHVPACRSLAGLTKGNQILLTAPAFDHARCQLKKEELKEFGALLWLSHGLCQVPGIESPVEICEIREPGDGSTNPPAGLVKAGAEVPGQENIVLGWRPAPGATIPGTRNVLEGKLADGRFGEDWSGGDPSVKEKRMFQFCFRSDWVRMLKEKEAVFQSVKQKLGQQRNVLAVQAVSFDQPPFYICSELFEGKDLLSWAQGVGGAPAIPFATRLEIVAQAATGLQAAHEGKLLHLDLSPEHILVAGSGATLKDVQVKLTNFAVGHVGRTAQPTAPSPSSEAPAAPAGGTPPVSPADLYKAPEVIAGNPPTAKSEVYSLGIILCQLILGNLSEPVAPERIKEILTGLKREGMLGLFAANPQERAEGAGRLAGDLRAVIKERESRTGPAAVTRRRMFQTVASIVMGVVSLTILSIYGPKYLRRRKAAAKENLNKPDKKPDPKKKRSGEEDSSGSSVTSEESRDAGTEAKEGEEESNALKTTSRPASAVREKKKEEVKESAEMLFKLIILPIAVVVLLGTVVQQVVPMIKKHLNKGSSS